MTLWTAGRVMVTPCEKQPVLFVLACCPRQGRCKVLTYLVWVLVLSGCSLAGPFRPAGSLRIIQLPQLSTCLQQQWRSKFSTSNKSVHRWERNKHRVSRGYLRKLMLMSACQGDLPALAWGVHSHLCVEVESMYINAEMFYCVQLMGHSSNSCCCRV